MTKYKQHNVIGANKSPLDIMYTSFDTSTDWDIKRSVTNTLLEELWVEAINTTNGDKMAMVITFKSGTLKITICHHIDLLSEEASQPGVSPSGFSTTQFSSWGVRDYFDDIAVVIDRDYFYFGAVLTRIGKQNCPYKMAFIISSIEKLTSFNDGILFAASSKFGDSYKGIYYEGQWYADSAATSPIDLMGRFNALFNSGMYSAPVSSRRFFYSKLSVHVNLIPQSDNTDLVLLGNLPSGIFGVNTRYAQNFDMDETLPEGDYVGFPSTGAEGINTFLFKK